MSATAIQKIARGRSARGYVKRLRGVYKRAATVIEAGARGMFGRRRVRRIRTEATAIIKMQRQMRAKIARMEYAKALKASRQGRAVSTISRAYRGLLGRRRMAHKRALVRAAKVAAEAVSVRQLFRPTCSSSLTRSRRAADHTQPYPPAAVLGLLRIVVLMLSATADPSPSPTTRASACAPSARSRTPR